MRVTTTHYRDAKHRGVAWLLDQLHPDGSIGDPAEGFRFYRVPWTFTVAGQTEAAARVCGWIRANMLTAEGDFDKGLRVLRDAYAYRNATLIYGAHMARQYDLSYRGLAFLLPLQDEGTGGFPNDLAEDGTPGDDMDIPYACGCGLACVALGSLDRARAVGGFLRRIWEAQPELPERFYYTVSRARQEVVTAFDPARAFWYVVEAQQAKRQRWTVGGISAAFLCRLYLADPQPDYLDLARAYQDFSQQCTARQFDYPQVCKSGWGAALLFQVTGEPAYGHWAARVGDWFVDTQDADGAWRSENGASLGRTVEITAEFTVHLDSIIGGLESWP